MIIAISISSRKKKDTAEELGIHTSTFSLILKTEREAVQKIFTHNSACKRKRAAGFPDLEACLLKWFKQSRTAMSA